MYILQAQNRSQNVKAKKLRKLGFVPASIYGKNLKEPLHIQIPHNEVLKMLKTKTKGSTLTVNADGKDFTCLIKDYTYDILTNTVEYISFQNLIENEMVTSTVNIVLVNKDKTPCLIQQSLLEIPYRAYPSDLVDKVYIDLEGLTPGSVIKVEDLDIAKNSRIELLIEPETVVLTAVDKSRLQMEEPAEQQEQQIA